VQIVLPAQGCQTLRADYAAVSCGDRLSKQSLFRKWAHCPLENPENIENLSTALSPRTTLSMPKNSTAFMPLTTFHNIFYIEWYHII